MILGKIKKGCLLSLLILVSISIEAHGQLLDVEDLYGKWRITGNFKNGKQLLTALNDTIKNPTKYYKVLYEDGSYVADVVSLKWGYKGKKMTGIWYYNSENNSLVFERWLGKKERRTIPATWVKKKENIYFLVPVEYPIVELSRHRLVLHDLFHDTYNIYTR